VKKTKTKLKIPVLISDPVLNTDQDTVVAVGVEVDMEHFTMDRESMKCVRCILEEKWDLENIRRITLCGLRGKLKILMG
jgi:hypothetical protein